jgi:hypothetical protein
VGLTTEYIELSRSNSEMFNVGARDPRFGMQPQTALLAEMRQTQDSLRSLAEQTGGLAAINANSFASSFDRIVQANSLYYMVGYYPPSHPRDGRFHKIEVRAKRPGLQVSARRGYASARGRTPAEREKIEREKLARANMKGAPDHTSWDLREALNSPLQRPGLTLSLQAAPFRMPGRTASVALAIEIDASRIQFSAQNDKKLFANKVELSLFSISQQGKPMQGIRTELDLTLRPDTYERVKTHGLRVNSRVDLAPGRYQLRVGVRESGAGETGTVFYDLDVPDFGREPLMMSGLLLTAPSAQRAMTAQADDVAGKALPGPATSSRRFLTSDAVALYAEIYAATGDIAPRIDVTTRLIAESGREVSVARDELAAGVAASRDKSTTYALTRSVALRDVPPGSYLLRVEAQRRGEPERVAVRETPITVVGE